MLKICPNVKEIYFLSKFSIGSKNVQDDKLRDQLGYSVEEITKIIQKFKRNLNKIEVVTLKNVNNDADRCILELFVQECKNLRVLNFPWPGLLT